MVWLYQPTASITRSPVSLLMVCETDVTASGAVKLAVSNGVVWSTPVHDTAAIAISDGLIDGVMTMLFAPVAGAMRRNTVRRSLFSAPSTVLPNTSIAAPA